MRIPRIYIPAPLSDGLTVILDGNGSRHVSQVLRLGDGDSVILFNGDGGEFEAVISRVERGAVEVAVGRFHDREVKSPLSVHLGQGVSRGERMDFTIQKGVELGLARITPLMTERCVVKLSGSRLDKRVEHWRAVASSACEQCGRNDIPPVDDIQALPIWLKDVSKQSGLPLLLHPDAEQRLSDMANPDGPVFLLIGPEGGLSDAESDAAMAAGFTGVRLGPRILRTETAALAALSAMQALWGDF